MALVIAMAMVLAMTTAAWAASDYKITVTNSSETVSINGKTFYAYKLFDATYSGTTTTSGGDTSPHAYSIKNDNWFYTNTASKAALDKYFDFTASVNDATRTEMMEHLKTLDLDDSSTETIVKLIDEIFKFNNNDVAMEVLIVDYDDNITINIKDEGKKNIWENISKDLLDNKSIKFTEVLGFNNTEYVIDKS